MQQKRNPQRLATAVSLRMMPDMGAEPNLYLWDIDGTLISVGGAGERALIHAIKEIFGIDGGLSGINYAGRTDRRISHMLHEYYEIPKTDESLQSFLDSYISRLQIEMKNTKMHLLDNVVPIIEAIRDTENQYQGLLTGNLERGAEIKLEHYGVWDFFPFGAYSNLSMDRNELASHSFDVAEKSTGIRFSPSNTYVIGDTPHDIECGKHIGAKTIAVCTGRFTPDDLRPLNPDYLWEKLPAPTDFFQMLDAQI